VTRYDFGAHDERGALNLIDSSATLRGLACASTGTVVPLSLSTAPGEAPIAPMRTPLQHFMARDGGDYAAGLPERPGFGFADDSILLACHGTTHLDALSHVWQDGVMYNGFSASEVTSRGARRCGIEKSGPFVTRGFLVDAVPPGRVGLDPGETVPLSVLLGALDGLSPEPGDALLLRTGWIARWREDPSIGASTWPGLDTDCIDWILDSGFALVGADTIGVEVCPSTDPACSSPLHIALIRDNGVYFMELLDLDALSLALAAAGRREFLLVAAPMPLHQAVGSPVAPVAVL
jgi:kynurenine formamidase